MKRRGGCAATLLVAVLAASSTAAAAPPPIDSVFKSERHSFKLEVVADALDTPWGLEFLPDGRIILTERPGRIRILAPGMGPGEEIEGVPRPWLQQDGALNNPGRIVRLVPVP